MEMFSLSLFVTYLFPQRISLKEVFVNAEVSTNATPSDFHTVRKESADINGSKGTDLHQVKINQLFD
jgi:hypothetical protein